MPAYNLLFSAFYHFRTLHFIGVDLDFPMNLNGVYYIVNSLLLPNVMSVSLYHEILNFVSFNIAFFKHFKDET